MSAVPFGPGTDIWRSCRFVGALFRSLSALPGGIGRFIPCDIGATHCRLRHIGWEKCGHGLISRSREAASERFVNEPLLLLLRYPPRSAAALLEGTLPLRCCPVRLLVGFPLGAFLLFFTLLTLSLKGVRRVGIMRVEHGAPAGMPGFDGGDGVDWISGPGGDVERVRLNRKTPAPLVRRGIWEIQSRPRVWKRLRVLDHSCRYHADAKARRVHRW